MDESQPMSNQRKSKNKWFDLHAPVAYPAMVLIVVFIALTLIFNQQASSIFNSVQTAISNYAGWVFILAVNVFLLFMLYLAGSRFGYIRLGGRDAEPEFSTFSWFAMLFSAGMGIGILFWSVAEPIYHFTSPPFGEAGTVEAASQAMDITFLHWGLHAWGIYALVALALAFFAYNRNMPLTIRSVFYPVLGERVYGWIGDLIDILAVIATLFGLATSLGLGVKQISAGLQHLFEIPNTVTTQVTLIALITGAATLSVVLGLDKGVKVLSQMNMNLGALFLVFVIIAGPTLFIFDSFVQNIGSYVTSVVKTAFWTESYMQSDWQNSWTVFYWAWWISWSPFVGMFIARVSKGRTVREFILGVLIVPTLLTFLWLSSFGGSAIYLELQGLAEITSAVKDNVSTALYVLLGNFPLSFISSLLGVILVTSFFITSSDSGSLVVDSLTAGGKLDAPVGQRVFWAVTEGTVAAVLLIGGGLSALQTAAITTGLPFTFVLLLMCYSVYQGLKQEHESYKSKKEDRRRQTYRKLINDVVDSNTKNN